MIISDIYIKYDQPQFHVNVCYILSRKIFIAPGISPTEAW